MVSRNKLEESGNVTVCDDGQSFQICNSSGNMANGTVAYLVCGDLFQNEYTCNWHNTTKSFDGGEIATAPRQPLGELCEININSVITATPVTTISNNNHNLEIGLGIGVGVGLPLIAGLALGIYYFKESELYKLYRILC